MSWLFFLGALPAWLVVLPMGTMVLFKVYGRYCTKHDEKYTRITRGQFLLRCAVYWREELCMKQWLASHGVLSRYCEHLSSLQLQQEWLQNYYSDIVCTTVNFMYFWFNSDIKFVCFSLDYKWCHAQFVSLEKYFIIHLYIFYGSMQN